MSRLARQPILKKPEISVTETGAAVVIKSQKGELSLPILSGTVVRVDGDNVWVSAAEDQDPGAKLGTMWANLRNAIAGVTEGFSKVLEIEGVGYRAAVEGKTVVLNLGFSHPIRYDLPEGVTAVTEKNTITISGIDKQKVGQAAAKIRSYRKPEPYKGKGIRYRGEVVRRKVGKKAATG